MSGWKEYLAARCDAVANWLRGAPRAPAPDEPASAGIDLGIDTVKYLGDLASESFKRQLELDESVWRSLPFVAATFAFVATLVGKAALDVPPWEAGLSGRIALVLLIGAVCSLAWTLRWFWVVLKPRQYEYPTPDHQVKRYAEEVWAFYAESGVEGSKALDEKTLMELRLFMIDQYGSASATNLGHNADKLKARTKVLLFMLLGFALAFACESTIFLSTHIGARSGVRGTTTDATAISHGSNGAPGECGRPRSEKAGASEGTAGDGRCQLLGRQLQGGHPEQTVSRNRPAPPPPVTGLNPQRPTPPKPQVIAKDSAINQGNTNPRQGPDPRKSGEQ
jgi:hypothetical protein